MTTGFELFLAAGIKVVLTAKAHVSSPDTTTRIVTLQILAEGATEESMDLAARLIEYMPHQRLTVRRKGKDMGPGWPASFFRLCPDHISLSFLQINADAASHVTPLL